MTVSKIERTNQPSRVDDFLRLMVERGVSDLHLKPTRRPLLRIDGRLVPLGEEPLPRGEIGRMLKDVLQPHQKVTLEKNLAVDFGYGVPGTGALSLQRLLAAWHLGGGVPDDSDQREGDRGSRVARYAVGVLRPEDGSGAGHRADGKRQIDHLGGADEVPQSTGPSISLRSKTRSSSSSRMRRPVSRNERSASTRPTSAKRFAMRFAKTPTSSWLER